MPTYEYHCDACHHEFEEFQSMKEEPLKKCPKCQKSKLRRLFGTGAALLFKGSGFYETDYRSESYKAAAKADAEKASGSSSESSTQDGKASGESPKPTAEPARTTSKTKTDSSKSSK